jgi:hypothetical protein
MVSFCPEDYPAILLGGEGKHQRMQHLKVSYINVAFGADALGVLFSRGRLETLFLSVADTLLLFPRSFMATQDVA